MKKVFLLVALLATAFAEDMFDSSELDDVGEDDLELLRVIEEKHTRQDYTRENEIAKHLANKIAADFNEEALRNMASPLMENPCSKVHCSAGKVCEVRDNVAQCICIPDCPEETEPRRRVCTNLNETWSSDCEVHRQRCLCDTNDPQCKGKEIRHIHINYYGECKELRECNEDEMKDFPRRMREWLSNVMNDLADRNELAAPYVEMIHEAETNLTKRWINAAVWKWCDLDSEHDRSVSRHELFPIRANLLSLESCIAPFLEKCDSDDDHRITLNEWGTCLELEVSDLQGRCAEINQSPNEIMG